MLSGHVISYKSDKGYGFIKPDDGSNNVYVHVSALQAHNISTLTEGQRVSYELLTENNKTSAINITLI